MKLFLIKSGLALLSPFMLIISLFYGVLLMLAGFVIATFNVIATSLYSTLKYAKTQSPYENEESFDPIKEVYGSILSFKEIIHDSVIAELLNPVIVLKEYFKFIKNLEA